MIGVALGFLKNWRTIAIGLGALALLAGGGIIGWRLAADHYQAKQLAAVQKAVADYKAAAERQNAIADQFERAREKANVVYKTITKTVDRVVERPVYRNVCLDADGLRAANAALAGSAADPRQPHGAVPAPGATRERHGGGGAAQAGRGR